MTTVRDITKNPMTVYIKNRIKKNKNFLVAITGPTGSGKTYAALKLAKMWDDSFDEDRIVFTPETFISLINGGSLKSGSVIVFEEAGVSLNNRAWQSKSNNLIQYILQTFRHKNYIVIFTAPDFGFIDSASRKLFHAHFMTMGINFTQKKCNIKPYFIQINQRTGNMYYKFLKVLYKGRGELKIGMMGISKPDKETIKKYEIVKTTFTTKLNEEAQQTLNGDGKADKKDKLEIETERKVTAIQQMRDDKKSWADIAKLLSYTNGENARMWFSRNRTHSES